MRTCMRLSALGLALAISTVSAASPFKHSWNTVRDVMGMHGKFSDPSVVLSDADVEFVANNYPMVTSGCGCPHHKNDALQESTNATMEDAVLAVMSRIKAVNPDVATGMYYRTPFVMEIAECSWASAVWAAHPEWRLKTDNGSYVTHNGDYSLDYSNPEASNFFVEVMLNVTGYLLPTGQPALNYVYLDGGGSERNEAEYSPGIGPERSRQLMDAFHQTLHNIQQAMDQRGLGRQGIILNAMDTQWQVNFHVSTGAAGSMFDHWSILQFVNRADGTFNQTAMIDGINLATQPLVSNHTIQVKGWPGPIIRQRDEYPPNIPTPTTPAEFKAMSAARFNSELALFLLLADEYNFWIYSFFWNWQDFVPNATDSTVPDDFFPESKCALGEPMGPATRVANTVTYKRSFAHASVFVDLANRTNSHVAFDGSECK